MEDLNKYMDKQVNSLNTIRSMVQEITDKKEEYLKLEGVRMLTATEMEDNKAMTNVYHDVIGRNNLIIDFILDIKNTIFKIKLIRDSIDRNTQLGQNQTKQYDYFISLLQSILDMMHEKKLTAITLDLFNIKKNILQFLKMILMLVR